MTRRDLTASGVWEPRLLKGFNLSSDGYRSFTTLNLK